MKLLKVKLGEAKEMLVSEGYNLENFELSVILSNGNLKQEQSKRRQ